MLDLVIDQRRRSLGGFEVGRVLPFAKRRMVGPFIFFDHMGPVDLLAGIPDEVDVRPHPHIGLSTVTYLFERFERARREGGPTHGIQAWVALPKEDEEGEPSFSHHGIQDLPTFGEGGVTGRLIAGEVMGHRAAVRTHSPLSPANPMS